MLTEISNQFLNYCRLASFSEKSIESFSSRLKELTDFLNLSDVKSIGNITYSLLREFTSGYKNPSIHVKKSRVWCLRQLFHFFKLNGLVKINIATDFPYPKIEKTAPNFLTIDEYNRVLEYFFSRASDLKGMRNLSIVLILGILGLRLSTVIALNVDDIDIVPGLIWIAEKGRKERILNIPEVLCRVLFQYLNLLEKDRGSLFLSKRNKRISARTFQQIFKKAAGAIGIDKKLHAHLFRHTAATHLNKVAGTEITKHVLGHMWKKNTEKYAHLNPDKYAVYMQLHPFMEVEHDRSD